MKYVLVIIMWSVSNQVPTIDHVEFESYDLCDGAKMNLVETMQLMSPSPFLFVECYQKGY